MKKVFFFSLISGLLAVFFLLPKPISAQELKSCGEVKTSTWREVTTYDVCGTEYCKDGQWKRQCYSSENPNCRCDSQNNCEYTSPQTCSIAPEVKQCNQVKTRNWRGVTTYDQCGQEYCKDGVYKIQCFSSENNACRCDNQNGCEYTSRDSCGTSSTPTPTPTQTTNPVPSPTNTPLPSASSQPSSTSAPKKPVRIIISQFERPDQTLDPSANLNKAKIDLNFDKNGVANVKFQVNYDEVGQDVVVYYVQYKLKTTSTVPSVLPSPDSSGVTHLTSCAEITKPGNYVLDQDIKGQPNSICLYIYGVNNVNLDCNSHSIQGDKPKDIGSEYSKVGTLYINNVNNFTIKSCNIPKSADDSYIINTGGNNFVGNGIVIVKSSNGVISNNEITQHGFYVYNSDNIRFEKNKLNTAPYSLNSTTSSVIDGNEFNLAVNSGSVTKDELFPSSIGLSNGSNNKIINNVMDGKSDGVLRDSDGKQLGSDDGIILNNESNDIVQNNTINNVYDCGIETSYLIKNSTFSGNKIKNTGYCGIGAWYVNSWIGNIVTDNTTEDSPQLFRFERLVNQPNNIPVVGIDPGEDAIYFKDNNFNNNKLINQKSSSIYYPVHMFFSIDDPRVPRDKWILENNKLSNNDFGLMNFANLYPGKMIVDKGGNICKPAGTPDFPLKCEGGVAPTLFKKLQQITPPTLNPLESISELTTPTRSLPTPQPTPTSTPGPLKLIDFNNDGVINVFDYIIFAQKKLGK